MANLMILSDGGNEIGRVEGWEAGRIAAQAEANRRRESITLAAEGRGEEAGEEEVFEPAPHCESGTATGERCEWEGEAADLETVEWMPPQHRESHRAAGNSGSYPANGARRLRCCPDCAEMLREDAE